MRAITLALSLVACSVAMGDVYHVLHRRPSALLANLGGDYKAGDRIFSIDSTVANFYGVLVPRGLKLKANDEASTITIEGSQEAVGNAIKVMNEFDVAPRQMKARIVVKSVADKYESTTETQVSNNTLWSLEDGTTKLRFSVVPRINGDGSVTSTIQFKSDKRELNLISRSKFGEPVVLSVTDDGSMQFQAKGSHPSMIVTIVFEEQHELHAKK